MIFNTRYIWDNDHKFDLDLSPHNLKIYEIIYFLWTITVPSLVKINMDYSLSGGNHCTKFSNLSNQEVIIYQADNISFDSEK